MPLEIRYTIREREREIEYTWLLRREKSIALWLRFFECKAKECTRMYERMVRSSIFYYDNEKATVDQVFGSIPFWKKNTKWDGSERKKSCNKYKTRKRMTTARMLQTSRGMHMKHWWNVTVGCCYLCIVHQYECQAYENCNFLFETQFFFFLFVLLFRDVLAFFVEPIFFCSKNRFLL